MVEIQELKIGSLVKCKVSNDAGIYKVIAIDGVNNKVMLDGVRMGEWHGVDKIKGIPINDHSLQCLGFDNEEYKEGWIGIDVNNTSFVLAYPHTEIQHSKHYCWCYKQDRWPMFTELEYIHNLQRLFLDLTGKELEWTEPEPNTVKEKTNVTC